MTRKEDLDKDISLRLLGLISHINKIHDAGKKIYTVSKYNEGITLNIAKRKHNIRDVISGILKFLQYTDSTITINQNYLTKDLLVWVDLENIQHVIRNLLVNSIWAIKERFTNEEELKRSGKITITVQYEKEFLVISIEDNGIGIPKEKFPEIFKSSFSTKSGRHKLGGIGLGLSSSKVIIEGHGGELSFISEVEIEGDPSIDPGTTFFIRLPKK